MDAVNEREQGIKNALESAESARNEMQNLQADNQRILQEARAERDEMLKEARDMKNKVISEAKHKAQEEADKIIAGAREEIKNEKSKAINELKKNNLPYIVVLTDPTAGGITASYAMLGDIHIAEPGALIAFAGARVIQGTVREELPVGFQRSEYVEKTGFVDLIVERKDLREKIRVLLSILLKKNSAINSATNETSEDSRTLTKAAS